MTSLDGRAYGLHIRTDTLIPGLPVCGETSGEPDLNLFVDAGLAGVEDAIVLRLPPRDREPSTVNLATTDDHSRAITILYDDGVRFTIDAPARNVRWSWPAESSLADAATYLLGPILALVLRLRGIVCLHASAVIADGGVLLFAGAAGAGKSTAAAALHRSGMTVLADDVAAIEMTGDGFAVRPGYPALRLWPDTVTHLYGHEDALPLLTPNWEKRAVDLAANGDFPSQALPLREIFLLQDAVSGSSPVIAAATGADALIELIANSYPSTILDARLRRSEISVLGALANAVPIHRLALPDNPAHINQNMLYDMLKAMPL